MRKGKIHVQFVMCAYFLGAENHFVTLNACENVAIVNMKDMVREYNFNKTSCKGYKSQRKGWEPLNVLLYQDDILTRDHTA